MEVRWALAYRADSVGTDPETLFTLRCLEKMGYLKLENFDPRVFCSWCVWRGKDNLKIIFRNPGCLFPIDN